MPGGRAGLAVGLRALLADGREVQQVGRGLRHQPDRAAAGIRAEVTGIAAAHVDAARRTGAGALERPEQRRLAGAVAAHERGDLARRAARA